MADKQIVTCHQRGSKSEQTYDKSHEARGKGIQALSWADLLLQIFFFFRPFLGLEAIFRNGCSPGLH